MDGDDIDPFTTSSSKGKAKNSVSLRSRVSSRRSSLAESSARDARGSVSTSSDAAANGEQSSSGAQTPSRSVRFGSTSSSHGDLGRPDAPWHSMPLGNLNTLQEVNTPFEEKAEPTYGNSVSIVSMRIKPRKHF